MQQKPTCAKGLAKRRKHEAARAGWIWGRNEAGKDEEGNRVKVYEI